MFDQAIAEFFKLAQKDPGTALAFSLIVIGPLTAIFGHVYKTRKFKWSSGVQREMHTETMKEVIAIKKKLGLGESEGK